MVNTTKPKRAKSLRSLSFHISKKQGRKAVLVFIIHSHPPLLDFMKPDEAIVFVSASQEATLFPLPPLSAQLGLSFFFRFLLFYKNE